MQFKYLKTIMLFTILTSGMCIINNNLSIASQASNNTKKPSFARNMLNKLRGKSPNNDAKNTNQIQQAIDEIVKLYTKISSYSGEVPEFIENEKAGKIENMGRSINYFAFNINNNINALNKFISELPPKVKEELHNKGYCMLPKIARTPEGDAMIDEETLEDLYKRISNYDFKNRNNSCPQYDPTETLKVKDSTLEIFKHHFEKKAPSTITNPNHIFQTKPEQDTKKSFFARKFGKKSKVKTANNSTSNDFHDLKTKREELLTAVNNIMTGRNNSNDLVNEQVVRVINNYINDINHTIRSLPSNDQSKAKFLGYCIIPKLPVNNRGLAIADKSTLMHLRNHLQNPSCSQHDPSNPLTIEEANLR